MVVREVSDGYSGRGVHGGCEEHVEVTGAEREGGEG